MGISTNPATASESIPRSLSSHVSLNCGAGGTKRNVSIMYGAGWGGGEDDFDAEVQKLNWPPMSTPSPTASPSAVRTPPCCCGGCRLLPTVPVLVPLKGRGRVKPMTHLTTSERLEE